MSPGAILSLAWSSLNNRRTSAIFTIVAVAVSVMLFLGVDKLRNSARDSFQNTISGTDLIVGARTSPVSLVMFSVFHIGDPSANVTYESYEWLTSNPRLGIEWAVPISLGDNHQGYRVVGTTTDFFEHYAYRGGTPLAFKTGEPFDGLFDVVVGAEVAAKLGYVVGDEIILEHGGGRDFSAGHDHLPFTITGILEPTGTPVDKSVFTSLEAIEAIHFGWQGGGSGPAFSAEMLESRDFQPQAVSAVYVGLKSKSPFMAQRFINGYPREALIAAQPALAINEVWKLVGVAEKALLAVSAFVILVGLVSILTSIMTSLRERRREMAVLRATGAGPAQIMFLLISEAALLAGLGALLGIALTFTGMYLAAPIVSARLGLMVSPGYPGMTDLYVFLTVTIVAAVLGIIPAIQALRNSLADGLSIKL